jgi:hypothetical protein
LAQHIFEKREGSGFGFVPLTNGSGSGRPKNMRIRIWFQLRIPNIMRRLELSRNENGGKGWRIRGRGGEDEGETEGKW